MAFHRRATIRTRRNRIACRTAAILTFHGHLSANDINIQKSGYKKRMRRVAVSIEGTCKTRNSNSKPRIHPSSVTTHEYTEPGAPGVPQMKNCKFLDWNGTSSVFRCQFFSLSDPFLPFFGDIRTFALIYIPVHGLSRPDATSESLRLQFGSGLLSLPI